MTSQELMNRVEKLLDESKAGILTTVDAEGNPRSRWMTPRTLKGRPGAIYAVTSEQTDKVRHLRTNPRSEWMIQARSLSEIITLKGQTNVVDNPSLCAEFLECVGSQLTVFWKANLPIEHCVILETVVREGTYYLPMKASKETVRFDGER